MKRQVIQNGRLIIQRRLMDNMGRWQQEEEVDRNPEMAAPNGKQMADNPPDGWMGAQQFYRLKSFLESGLSGK